MYNFDLPGEAANYVHRIGRTARAGAKGSSYSLICEDYGQNLEAIRDYLGPQISIDVAIASDELLGVEDKSLNPYKDPKFKGTTAKTKAANKPERPQRGSSDKSDNRRNRRKGANAEERNERKNRQGSQDKTIGGNASRRTTRKKCR